MGIVSTQSVIHSIPIHFPFRLHCHCHCHLHSIHYLEDMFVVYVVFVYANRINLPPVDKVCEQQLASLPGGNPESVVFIFKHKLSKRSGICFSYFFVNGVTLSVIFVWKVVGLKFVQEKRCVCIDFGNCLLVKLTQQISYVFFVCISLPVLYVFCPRPNQFQYWLKTYKKWTKTAGNGLCALLFMFYASFFFLFAHSLRTDFKMCKYQTLAIGYL